MKAMKDAVEYSQAAPPGRYASRIVAAEAGFSKKGETMLHLKTEIIAPQQFAGQQADDYIGTDGTTKWGGMSKGRLRGLLGEQMVSTNDEIPDAQIAMNLLNRVYEVEYANEPKMTRSVADGPYDKEMTAVDKNGLTIVLQKLIVKNYHAANVAPQLAPPQQAQPQFQQPQQPQYAPQQAAPQYAPQGQQYAPGQMNPAGFAQPQYAQPGFAQPQFPPQGQMQGGFAPQAPQGAPVQGQMPWQQAPANGAPQGAPQEAAAPVKRGKKAAAQGEAEG